MSTIPIIEDCWKKIGVAGDHSCPKLTQHIHCRNCEVYSGAAQRNLQRPVDAAYLRDWADHFRAPESGTAAQTQSVLAFRIGREWLALPTKVFHSVAPMARAHRLPHRQAAGLLGLVNVAGKLYPAMSLAALLGITDEAGQTVSGRHSFPRLLVMQWDEQAYAMPVAEMHGMLRFAKDELLAPAATINKGISRYLSGVLSRADLHIGVLDEQLVGHQLRRLLG